jgi:hypothetical protein
MVVAFGDEFLREVMTRVTSTASAAERPSDIELGWLAKGLKQPGGKLPLFDEWGQKVNERTIRACIDHGWAEPWFTNPLKPDWLVCKLTDAGRRAVEAKNH